MSSGVLFVLQMSSWIWSVWCNLRRVLSAMGFTLIALVMFLPLHSPRSAPSITWLWKNVRIKLVMLLRIDLFPHGTIGGLYNFLNYSALTDGKHMFSIKATDSSGNNAENRIMFSGKLTHLFQLTKLLNISTFIQLHLRYGVRQCTDLHKTPSQCHVTRQDQFSRPCCRSRADQLWNVCYEGCLMYKYEG